MAWDRKGAGESAFRHSRLLVQVVRLCRRTNHVYFLILPCSVLNILGR